MSIIYILLPIALFLGFGFLIAFIYSSYAGQYDDLETPAHRLLIEPSKSILNSKHKERKHHVI